MRRDFLSADLFPNHEIHQGFHLNDDDIAVLISSKSIVMCLALLCGFAEPALDFLVFFCG
ncbi:hypothetical protein D3C78_1807040 [compost metagenome]